MHARPFGVVGIGATRCQIGLVRDQRAINRNRRAVATTVVTARQLLRLINRMRTSRDSIEVHTTLYFPCAMALRLITCSPRKTALLPPSPARSFVSPGLSASTAAPEPHDLMSSPLFRPVEKPEAPE